MNCTQIQELAAAHALGALDAAEAARFQAMVEGDEGIRAEFALFANVVRRLAEGVAPVAPSPRVRVDLMARIARTPQLKPATAADRSQVEVPGGFRFLRPSAGPWTEGPVPGVRLQVLSADWRRNQVLLYIELDPGAHYPDHTHTGPEDLYLVSGDLLTGGRLVRAGDFVHCDAGSHHDQVISPSGCQALLMTSMTSAVGEFAKGQLAMAGGRLAGVLGLGRDSR